MHAAFSGPFGGEHPPHIRVYGSVSVAMSQRDKKSGQLRYPSIDIKLSLTNCRLLLTCAGSRTNHRARLCAIAPDTAGPGGVSHLGARRRHPARACAVLERPARRGGVVRHFCQTLSTALARDEARVGGRHHARRCADDHRASADVAHRHRDRSSAGLVASVQSSSLFARVGQLRIGSYDVGAEVAKASGTLFRGSRVRCSRSSEARRPRR